MRWAAMAAGTMITTDEVPTKVIPAPFCLILNATPPRLSMLSANRSVSIWGSNRRARRACRRSCYRCIKRSRRCWIKTSGRCCGSIHRRWATTRCGPWIGLINKASSPCILQGTRAWARPDSTAMASCVTPTCGCSRSRRFADMPRLKNFRLHAPPSRLRKTGIAHRKG